MLEVEDCRLRLCAKKSPVLNSEMRSSNSAFSEKSPDCLLAGILASSCSLLRRLCSVLSLCFSCAIVGEGEGEGLN